MKHCMLLAMLLSLVACQSMTSNDPASLAYSIPDGSVLRLNKDLPIDAGNTHVYIQYGELTTENGRNRYNLNCRFNLKAFGPRTIAPESFRITRTENGEEWISQPSILKYYTEVYLASDKGTDVIKLECQFWGKRIDRHFTVADMEATLGEYFSIVLASAARQVSLENTSQPGHESFIP